VIKTAVEEYFPTPVPFEVLHRLFWGYIEFMVDKFLMKRHAMEILSYLSAKHYNIGLISNVFHPSIVYKELFTRWKIFDFFNPMLFSSDFPVKKPHPEIFRMAMNIYPDYLPEEFVFIGDTFDIDIIGAARAGMIPVWLTSHNHTPDWPDLCIINDLEDIRSIL
ncbi:HAD family hydrolase, partial [bacterium]|nr:HAD family hydrolase [candidate division CSSED10-310 bacterium]